MTEQPKPIKRYVISSHPDDGAMLIEHNNGDYVLFGDHAETVRQLQRENDFFRCSNENIEKENEQLRAELAAATKYPPDLLIWLYTHCRAIGMDCKSESGKFEHDIALWTKQLADKLYEVQRDIDRRKEAEQSVIKVLSNLSDELAAAKQQNEMMDVALSAINEIRPGVMRCAKCHFQLTRVSLNVNAGTVTAGDNKTEPCPNGCGPLWPITWREYARQADEDAEKCTSLMLEASERSEQLRTELAAPVDMILHCPACGMQHIDEPELREVFYGDGGPAEVADWINPPHRSHLCHSCGHIWRPSDRATNGVLEIKTKGKDDSETIAPMLRAELVAANARAEEAEKRLNFLIERGAYVEWIAGMPDGSEIPDEKYMVFFLDKKTNVVGNFKTAYEAIDAARSTTQDGE